MIFKGFSSKGRTGFAIQYRDTEAESLRANANPTAARALTDLYVVPRARVYRSYLTAGLRREFHGWMGPGGRQVPEWASGFTVGRHEIRLGVLRGVAAGRAVDSRHEKTGRWSTCSMGRRGARRRLSRMHAGNPPRRERADDNVKHGNAPFAVAEKRGGIPSQYFDSRYQFVPVLSPR